jgi:hypothetical protein
VSPRQRPALAYQPSAIRGIALIVLATSFLSTWQASAAAQHAALAGTVRRGDDQSGISGAEVSIRVAQRSISTDSGGTFRLSELAPGRHVVIVRRVGFIELTDTVDLLENATLNRDYVLSPQPPILDSVVVTAPHTDWRPPQLQAFDARRTQGLGHFLTEADLRQDGNRSIASIIVRIPGSRIIRYQGAAYLASGRGEISLPSATGRRDGPTLQHAVPNDERSPVACWTAIVVDGIRVFAPNLRQPVPDLTAFEGRDLAGIEYYSGPSTTPAEFNQTGSACGTLVLWTRWR